MVEHSIHLSEREFSLFSQTEKAAFTGYDMELSRNSTLNFTDGNATNTDRWEELKQSYEHPVRDLFLIALHTVTLSCLAAFGKTMHARVEIKHPVFAVIFQQILFFGLGEFICFVLRLVLIADPQLKLYFAIQTIWTMMQQFHQITWLVVTTLRYHLLFGSKSVPDVQSLTRKSIYLTWMLWLLQGVLFSFTWFMSLHGKGWPVVKIEAIEWTLWEMTGQFAVMNFPDFMSIIIYLFMLKEMRTRNSVQDVPQIVQDVAQDVQNDNQNLDIWVGPIEPNDPEPDEMQVPMPQEQDGPSDEATKVVKKLAVHVSFSLLDFFALLLVRILGSPSLHGVAVHILVYVYSYVFCIWMPLVVIKANCKNLDGMLQYIVSLVFSA